MTDNRIYKIKSIYTRGCCGCDIPPPKHHCFRKCKGEGLCRWNVRPIKNWKYYRNTEYK